MSFLILVPTKRVPDTDGLIRIRDDGLDVDATHLSFVITPFDAIALEEALRIGERQDDVEVVVAGIGGEAYEDELRTALAMGADRAVRVAAVAPLDPWNVARILATLVDRLEPRMVLMGKQAVDDDAAQVGQFHLDHPRQVAELSPVVQPVPHQEGGVGGEADVVDGDRQHPSTGTIEEGADPHLGRPMVDDVPP